MSFTLSQHTIERLLTQDTSEQDDEINSIASEYAIERSGLGHGNGHRYYFLKHMAKSKAHAALATAMYEQRLNEIETSV